ncbi:MAG: protein kinase [Deltaproteobacteria bacterium]|nr:protein kinase [Deltaproteobacteria bacterium]
MPQVGEALGRYVLLKKLAVGGMGEIFIAAKTTPLGFAPPVALKVLREELASDQVFVDMLIDEANITKYLNHQNVVSVLDFGEDKRTYFIAMEYVQGITLKDLLTRTRETGRKPDLAMALYIGSELCRALRYAHTRTNNKGEPMNIVHRDVTPGNVLLSTQGEVKLTDFGIARAKGRIHQTQAGVLKGKFGYMAPEMVRYERIDARADLFCVGVVLYELVTGQHPVEGCTIMEAIERFDRGAIDAPSRLNREVPEKLDFVLRKALEPRAENRWDSAQTLGNELQDLALNTKQGREDLKGASRQLTELIRSLVPAAFDPPVPRETLDRLLEEARARDEREKKAAPPKPAPAPAKPAAQEDERPFSFRPIVTDSSEVPTGDGFSTTEDSIGPTLIPSHKQVAPVKDHPPEIVKPSEELRTIDGVFPDTSTDRQRMHDDMLDEQPLPGADNTMPLRAVRPEVEERTVASADYEQIRALEEAANSAEPTNVPGRSKPQPAEPADPAEARREMLDEESLPLGTNLSRPTDTDDKTIAGVPEPNELSDATLSMPRVASAAAPIIIGPGSKSPLGGPISKPAPKAPVSELAKAVQAAVADPKSEGDATLLDGIKLADIEAERKKLEAAGQIDAPTASDLDEQPLDRPLAPEPEYSDDSTQAYIYEPDLASPFAPPAKLTGPLKIKLGEDGELEQAPKSVPPSPKFEQPKPPTSKKIDPVAAKKASTAKQETASAISAADDAAAKLLISTLNKPTPTPSAASRPRPVEATAPRSGPQHTPTPRPSAPHASAPQAMAQGSLFPSELPQVLAPSVPESMGLGAKLGIVSLVLLLVVMGMYSRRVGWPSIEIQSDPQGATVILDGDTLSQPTPLRATIRPFQTHEIRFVRKGYVSETLESVSLGLFEQETKLITLRRPTVEVQISPIDAEVLVNGKLMTKGRKASVLFDRDDGNLLEVRAPGYAPWSAAYGPGEAPTTAVDVVLSALPTPPPAPPP